MQQPSNPNLMILELAVDALGSLADDMLLDGRPAIVEDVRNADEVVKNAIKEQFSALIKNERFLEAIPGHVPGDAASQARVSLIMERVEVMANLE